MAEDLCDFEFIVHKILFFPNKFHAFVVQWLWFDRINSSDFIELFSFPRQLIHNALAIFFFHQNFFFLFCSLFAGIKLVRIVYEQQKSVAL